MSNEQEVTPEMAQVVATFTATVVFDQLANGTVNYRVELDPIAGEHTRFTPLQLSERGECLAHLGIRAVNWLLMERAAVEALDMASKLRRRAAPAQGLLLAGDGRRPQGELVIN